MKDNIKLIIVFIIIGCGFIGSVLMTCHTIYRKGYEDAVEDFYKGKLKCERIEEPKTTVKYIWKKEK